MTRFPREFMVNDATIQRSPKAAGSQRSEPVDVHIGLACSRVTELSDGEAEKAGLATITRPCRVFVEVPESGVIKEQDKFLIPAQPGREYLVVKAKMWPHDSPRYYELLLDYQR